jgi:uncharacterized protein YjbJ (UPF0337 family)
VQTVAHGAQTMAKGAMDRVQEIAKVTVKKIKKVVTEGKSKSPWLSINFSKTRKEGNFMNWDQIKGNWKQLKGKVREKWGKLTDQDLEIIGGKKDQLVGKLQNAYGYQKEQAEKEVDEFCRNC